MTETKAAFSTTGMRPVETGAGFQRFPIINASDETDATDAMDGINQPNWTHYLCVRKSSSATRPGT